MTAPLLPSTQLALLKALGVWTDQESDGPILSPTQADSLLLADSQFALWVNSRRQASRSSEPIASWLSANLWNLLQQSHSNGDELELLRSAANRALQTKLLRKQFQQEIGRSKQEMLYHLAYGLSHEINNPLANISTRAQMLLKTATSDKDRHALAIIIDQVQRAHEMIGDLMQCSQEPHIQLAWVDTRSTIHECFKCFETFAHRQSTELSLRVPEQPVLLRTDSKLLMEILSILVRNALESLARSGHVLIELKAEKRQIEFCIIDSGKGLSLEARKHALDPFYSGREAGRGLGMGLSKANHFARCLRANLSLDSHTNAGCIAKLQFDTES